MSDTPTLNPMQFILACDFPDTYETLKSLKWYPLTPDLAVWSHPTFGKATLTYNFKSLRGHTITNLFLSSHVFDLEYWTEVAALLGIHQHINQTQVFILETGEQWLCSAKENAPTQEQRAARGLRHLASMVEKKLVALTDIHMNFSRTYTESGLPTRVDMDMRVVYDVKHLPEGSDETDHRRHFNDLNSLVQITGPYNDPDVITNGEDNAKG